MCPTLTSPMATRPRRQVPILILNADDDPVCKPRNVDDNAPALLGGRSCPRAVLLRYGKGGHCCFARGLTAARWADQLSAAFLAEAANGAVLDE